MGAQIRRAAPATGLLWRGSCSLISRGGLWPRWMDPRQLSCPALLWPHRGRWEMPVPSLPCLSWGRWGGERKPSAASLCFTCCFPGSFYNIHLWKQPLFASIITRIFLHLSVIIGNWSIVWGTKYSVTWKWFIAALFLKMLETKMLGQNICAMSVWLQSSYKRRRPGAFYQGKPEVTNWIIL